MGVEKKMDSVLAQVRKLHTQSTRDRQKETTKPVPFLEHAWRARRLVPRPVLTSIAVPQRRGENHADQIRRFEPPHPPRHGRLVFDDAMIGRHDLSIFVKKWSALALRNPPSEAAVFGFR